MRLDEVYVVTVSDHTRYDLRVRAFEARTWVCFYVLGRAR